MTALGQHSMVPPFYANQARVAPRAPRVRHPQCDAPPASEGCGPRSDSSQIKKTLDVRAYRHLQRHGTHVMTVHDSDLRSAHFLGAPVL